MTEPIEQLELIKVKTHLLNTLEAGLPIHPTDLDRLIQASYQVGVVVGWAGCEEAAHDGDHDEEPHTIIYTEELEEEQPDLRGPEYPPELDDEY